MIRSQREVGAYRERLDGHSATFTIQYHQWASLKGGLNIGTRYSRLRMEYPAGLIPT